ncbi:MAG: hypothetical protein Q8P67_25735 [archaeon]|nr:hypothetical protein [archaeon]
MTFLPYPSWNSRSWSDGRGVHVLLSKELGCWVYLSTDISGEESQKPIAIAYTPSPFWQQETWGKFVIAPSLGMLGAGSLYASTRIHRSLFLQTSLQVTGVSLICAALYKGLLDPYLHDHARQLSRVRAYLASHRSWVGWSSLLDSEAQTLPRLQHSPDRDPAKDGGARQPSTLRINPQHLDSVIRVEDYLTPLERGNFYRAHAACDLSRLNVPGSQLANLGLLYEVGAISRTRFDVYRRISEMWSSKEDEKLKKQSRIETEFDEQIAGPLAALHHTVAAANAEFDNTPAVREHAKLNQLLLKTKEAISSREYLDKAIIRAIPPSPDKKSPNSHENLERKVRECSEAELQRVQAEFEYHEASLHKSLEESREKLTATIAAAECAYRTKTLGARNRRERMLEDMNDEYLKLDSRLQSQLQERDVQASREEALNFNSPNYSIHSSIPEAIRDQTLLELLNFLATPEPSSSSSSLEVVANP